MFQITVDDGCAFGLISVYISVTKTPTLSYLQSPPVCLIGGTCYLLITSDPLGTNAYVTLSYVHISQFVTVSPDANVGIIIGSTYTFQIPKTFSGVFFNLSASIYEDALLLNSTQIVMRTEMNRPPALLSFMSIVNVAANTQVWLVERGQDPNLYHSTELRIRLVRAPSNGALNTNLTVSNNLLIGTPNGGHTDFFFSYRPNQGFSGSDSMSFQLIDPMDEPSITYNIQLRVSRNVTEILKGGKISEEESRTVLESIQSSPVINATEALENVAILAVGLIKNGLSSVNINTSKLSMTVQILNLQGATGISGDSASSSAIIPSGALNSFNSSGAFALLTMFKFNPYSESQSGERIISNVTSLSILDSDGEEIQVSELPENDRISIRIEIEENSDSSQLNCIWWDTLDRYWKNSGCSLELESSRVAVCTCSHLTSFTVSKKVQTQNVIPTQEGNSNSNVAAIVAPVVIGILLLLVLVVVAILLIKRRKKAAAKSSASDLEMVNVGALEKDDINVQDKIGQGGYAVVFKGTYKGTTPIAVKKLIKESGQWEFLKEIETVKRLHHPHIIQFLGIFRDEYSKTCIVLEYMEKGSLLDNLRESTLDSNQLIRIACDISAGMTYLEGMDVVHCDISARNCLLSGENRGKISDFGHAMTKGEKGPSSPAVRWASPEVLESREYSHSSDVWSFGVVLYEIFNQGKVPYQNLSNDKVQSKVMEGLRLEFPSDCPKEIRTIAESCWREPVDRPNIRSISGSLSSLLETDANNRIEAVEASHGEYVG
eukprot:TRINITY_DN7390_c0_g1_i1.p1 TRINITY_DN7390_c0_g1~~TRINITY_DN7390_c0_g1_i1.p1  ORF type:complete len:775 (-),score=140.96 TRINITY_DN7390_c0_g1_i1:1197-3521(-)